MMAWCRSGDKPLYETIMVILPTHICVTQPKWVNLCQEKQNCLKTLTCSIMTTTNTVTKYEGICKSGHQQNLSLRFVMCWHEFVEFMLMSKEWMQSVMILKKTAWLLTLEVPCLLKRSHCPYWMMPSAQEMSHKTTGNLRNQKENISKFVTIAMPADSLAPQSARLSSGMVMTRFRSYIIWD